MTTPHKALLIQARDALRLSATPLAKDRQEVLQAIAALQAAIDAPEPKGLFIDMIAQHEGLAEELRDLPEPYDQQALEPCPVCGWKAIVPGEPCLMCERNARMLENATVAIDAPEPEPSRWHESTAELAAIYGEMCAIRATESKQTPLTQQQEARLVALRAECIALNYRRIAMVKEAPKPKPVATVDSIMGSGRPFISRLPGARLEKGQMLYLHPPAVREPLTEAEIIKIAQDNLAADPGRDGYILPIKFARAIEAAVRAKP